ncbi:MAG TPA: hypothetical protein DCZ94_22005 [Lentisphaeria bacterium]|nr:MAG: hypothetical protein A2X48_14970 [Lentisphaerae bacterium GWF2_49_21]HBC89621.1 hypothetical protein [Lentisphaeria bacterium]
MDTKKKILKAAAEEFAMKGYNGTTVRDICRRARVNVASINYHFKGKESLYKEMFEFLFKDSRAHEILNKPWNGDFAGWKRSLREWVANILGEITSQKPFDRCKSMIFRRELLNPSDIFPDIYESFMKPRLNELTRHFRKVLPAGIGDEDVCIRVFSVSSDCLFYMHDRPIVDMRFPGGRFPEENMRKIIDFITEKACYGLKINHSKPSKRKRRKK